ncbi:MAG TPA: hypothetical protein VLA29_11815 [Acidimicrobiia bacterium]|nr:hypothetical protein [Acidimicrobiia bacterium]
MKPSYGSAFGVGAIVGLVVAVAGTLFVGATGGISKLAVTGEGASIEPVFAVPASALWIVTIVAAAVIGTVLAVVTAAIARVIDPDTSGVGLWVIAPLGATVGGVVAFAVFPLGVTGLGTLQDGMATISVGAMVALAAIAGLAGGSVIVWQSYIMARPPVGVPDPDLLPADESFVTG